MAFLQVIKPDGSRLEPRELSELPLKIGRSPESGLQLDDSSVSREHALLSERGGRWWLEDVASVNGVWVNGERIDQPTELGNNDCLMIGDFELRLRLS